MHVVVTDRNLSPAEKASLPKDLACYYFQDSPALPGAKLLEPSAVEKKRLNYETLDHCLTFADKIIQGKTLREWVQFGKANIWYYHKFRLYFALRNLSYDLHCLESLSAQYPTVDFYTSRQIFSQLKGLPHNLRLHVQADKPQPINWVNLIHFGTLLLLRFLRSLGQFSHAKKARYALFNQPQLETPVRVPPDLRIQEDSPYYGYLFGHLDAQTLVLEEFDHPKLRAPQPFRLSRRLYQPRKECPHLYGDSLLIRQLFRKKVRKQVQQASQELAQCYPALQAASQSLWDQAVGFLLRQLHGTSRYYLFRYFAYAAFFAETKIQRFLAFDEGSPMVKSMLDAAREQGIFTLGLQHGTIHPLHMAYRFSPEDILEGDPIPDRTLVWGSYWQEVLHQHGNYPYDRMEAVGQARTDIIPYLDQLSRKDVLPQVPAEKKWVVFASQPQRDPQLRERAAADVFRAVAQHPDIFLIVKLHPREKDLSYYAKIAEREGCTHYVQERQVDLYSLIAVCDVLITCFSTVGAETVYFHKPLVVLDHLKQDIQNYIHEGVAFEANDAESLKTVLEDILCGKRSIDREAYDRFIAQYAHQIDGKTSLRVWGST